MADDDDYGNSMGMGMGMEDESNPQIMEKLDFINALEAAEVRIDDYVSALQVICWTNLYFCCAGDRRGQG
jgi:hypothetical protein